MIQILDNRIKKIQNTAMKLGAMSDHNYRLGAVVFKKNKVISVGYNNTKTHPKVVKYFKYGTLHAEADAILHCVDSDDLKGAFIFVSRVKNDMSPAMAKPCAMCVQLMHEYQIKKVYWTTNEFPYWDCAKVIDLYEAIDKKNCYINNCRNPSRAETFKVEIQQK